MAGYSYSDSGYDYGKTAEGYTQVWARLRRSVASGFTVLCAHRQDAHLSVRIRGLVVD